MMHAFEKGIVAIYLPISLLVMTKSGELIEAIKDLDKFLNKLSLPSVRIWKMDQDHYIRGNELSLVASNWYLEHRRNIKTFFKIPNNCRKGSTWKEYGRELYRSDEAEDY